MTPDQFSKSGKVFIALETGEENREKLQSLTNQVCRWSEDIWLLDISRFRRYWRSRSVMAKTSLSGIWRNILGQLFGETFDATDSNVITMSPLYRASCAENPWLAVILLHAMREKEIRGLVFQNSRSGESLLRQLSWRAWWRCVDILEHRFLETKTRGFKRPHFRRMCHRLKLAAPRLGFRLPWDMSVLNVPGVKKRYGEEIGNLWEWTYGRGMVDAETVISAGFPWTEYPFREPPVVKRIADYPLAIWDQMVPLLTEDLDKLSRALGNQGERVTRIDWRVTFEDLSTMTLPIRFRNPHDLRSESGRHLTSLLQAEYAFASAAARRMVHDTNGNQLESLPPILHWELSLIATITIPDIILNLFGEMAEENDDIDVLLRLENELPVALNRYQPNKGWLPEDSYIKAETALADETPPETEITRSLAAVAEDRPLYIRRSPLPLMEKKATRTGAFLESAMSKWWLETTFPIIERDYFKHVDPEGNAVWIFRDSSDNWYQHGVFG